MTMPSESQMKLFTPVQVGAITLRHRLVLPPLSRLRAQWPSAVLTAMMRECYAQRASDGGMVIAEATAVSPAEHSYHIAPGIWSDEQVEGWRRVTDAVHGKGGVVFVQLDHSGRATSSAITEVAPRRAIRRSGFLAEQENRGVDAARFYA